MKSKRLTRIEGTFMGIGFQVKPVPMNLEDIDEKQRNMLMDWYGENHPSLKEKLDGDADVDSFTVDELKAVTAWKKDVAFRSKYIKFLATSCMDFDKQVPEDYWAMDELPYSVVKEAWDFFTERRSV